MLITGWTGRAVVLVGVVLGGMAVWGWTRPSRWVVSRSVIVDAPTGLIYPMISNFKVGWRQWDHDARQAHVVYLGPEMGVGAQRVLTGQSKMHDRLVHADGRSMVVVERNPTDSATRRIIRITTQPDPRGVLVSIVLSGEAGWNPYLRLMGGLIDQKYGPQLESDLDKLKTGAESTWQAERPKRTPNR